MDSGQPQGERLNRCEVVRGLRVSANGGKLVWDVLRSQFRGKIVAYTYTVVDSDGSFIADRVTREELLHLRGLKLNVETGFVETALDTCGQPLTVMVAARKRKPLLWISTVDAGEIKTALRTIRGTVEQMSRCEANVTGYWQNVETSKGTFRVYTHSLRRSFNHLTTEKCQAEHLTRLMVAAERVAA